MSEESIGRSSFGRSALRILLRVRSSTLRCSVYVATSLDGFIAREDGSIDWLDRASASVPNGEDCGFADFMTSVDVMVMGRKTYEQIVGFGEWPYGDTPIVVLSRSLDELPGGPRAGVRLSSERPRELVARLASEGFRHVYVDGGATIQGFLADDLLDELTITVIPVVLGAGRRLFGALADDVHLEHESTRAFDFGFVQHRYRVPRLIR